MIGKIKEIKNPSGDFYTVLLEVDEDFSFKAGQFARFTIPGLETESGPNFRIFSICNGAPDGTLLLGTRSKGEEISSYKKCLLNMKEGEEVRIDGPMGNFTVRDDSSPMVLYAGGVGITPIRSILSSIKEETSRPVKLIYASGGYYLFEDEIRDWISKNPAFEGHFTRSAEETTKILTRYAKEYGNSAYYYTSGAPAVIVSVENNYKENGIEPSRLISDTFTGY